MPKTNLTSEFLNQTLEEYLNLDPNCNYITEAFYQINKEENETLEQKKKELEDALLDWLWFAKPRNKRFSDNGNQIELYFENDLSLQINDGVYYFEKTYYNKDDMQSDKTITFAIVNPATKNYEHFTSYLQKMVLESFNHSKEKKPILDSIKKIKTK